MKKLFSIFTILILFFTIISVSSVTSAATLNNVSAEVSKAKIAPGQEVNLTVSFGKDLGAYTVNAAYDDAIFEYVRSEGGTANDTGDKVILTYHDTTGGTNPRTNAVITFKAKAGLTTSNPTDFSVTLSGMANSDASETYDDITTPIIKDILVEPNYVNYTLSLDYTGVIKKDEAKEMKLTTASTMGKNYDHVRLIAEVTAKPKADSTAKLLATDNSGAEIDILQSGWGEADGYAIGGKDVKQELLLRGEFNTDGKYTVHIKLIDRDNSDAVIADKSFDITVGEKVVEKPTTNTKPTTEEKLPTTYPKTGMTQYVYILLAVLALLVIYFVLRNHKSAKRYKL